MAIGIAMLLIGFLAVILPTDDEPVPTAGSGTSGDDDGFSTQTTPDTTTTPPPPPPPEPEPEPEGFGNGVWRVGEDIDPGLYFSPGATGCYWARLSGFSGEFEDIEANEFGSDRMIVEILETDAGFESKSCARWIPLESHLNATTADRPYGEFGPGMFVVHEEVEPGQWRAPGGDGCYWARLSGFTGDFDDLTANEFSQEGQVIVTIETGDVGFESSGCGTWERLE